jgi:hypothetical protein
MNEPFTSGREPELRVGEGVSLRGRPSVVQRPLPDGGG